MPTTLGNDNSNNKKVVSSISRNSLEEIGKKQQKQAQVQDEQDFSHKGKNRHSKNTKEELRKHKEEQLILLKENKQNIIDFIIDNIDSIRLEDLKVYEPIYKCYRKKGHCHVCNTISNIIWDNCSNYKN